MKRKLNIITPVSRIELRDKVENSLIHLKSYFDINWLKIQDDKGADLGGGRKRNIGLDMVNYDEDSWLYHLDDDNCIHPHFGDITRQILDNDERIKLILYQYNLKPNGEVHSNMEGLYNFRPGRIDTALCFMHSSLSKDARWKENLYTSDSEYLYGIYKKQFDEDKRSIFFCKHKCVYYNYLRYQWY